MYCIMILALETISKPMLDLISFRCRSEFPPIFFILHGLIHTARTGSVYVTMSITFERYLAMVKPFNSNKVKKFLLPFAITFAILYNFPKVNNSNRIVSQITTYQELILQFLNSILSLKQSLFKI